MYIAFKWLVGLSFSMWFIVCLTDVYIQRNKQNVNIVFEDVKPFKTIFKNVSLPLEKNFQQAEEKLRYISMAFLHGAMFLTGAIAVIVFNRKSEIITYTKMIFSELNFRAITKKTFQSTCSNVSCIGDTIVKYIKHFSGLLKYINMKVTYLKSKNMRVNQSIRDELIKKLRDIAEERRNLGHILIAAINENKSLRTLYQLETMAKSRLIRHVEDTSKQVKENRSQCIGFQQLYLVTHQENAFLKARVGKLVKEKDEVENNLILLMNEVYKSKNKELKHFCTRFIVKTKKNFLNSDVSVEIKKFLKKRSDKTYAVDRQFSENREIMANDTKNWSECTLSDTDILEDASLVPFTSDAPKLKGLPGEYVWTVKDKDGIIEKLYECDYNNGDMIRRIRQYSVYHDKDCLLDFSNSKTVVHDIMPRRQRNSLSRNQRFLTGSEAFQQFMKCNENICGSLEFTLFD